MAKPKCPKCGVENQILKVQTERIGYDVSDIDEDGACETDSVQDCYEVEFVHIHCWACNTYWSSESEFAEEYVKATAKRAEVGTE